MKIIYCMSTNGILLNKRLVELLYKTKDFITDKDISRLNTLNGGPLNFRLNEFKDILSLLYFLNVSCNLFANIQNDYPIVVNYINVSVI